MWVKRVTVALITCVLCVCLFFASVFLSLRSSTHLQTSRASSTCPTHLSAPWCETEKEKEKVGECSFLKDRHGVGGIGIHPGISFVPSRLWASAPLWGEENGADLLQWTFSEIGVSASSHWISYNASHTHTQVDTHLHKLTFKTGHIIRSNLT